MANPRDIRTAALMMLFQKDAGLESPPSGGDGGSFGAVEAALEDIGTALSESERRRAGEAADRAWAHRREADDFVRRAAPGWPPHRMPSVDRAIIRLGYDEIARGGVNPKIVVNEAVELAKRFSTDRSPAFINAVLDKAMKELAQARQPSEPNGSEPVEA